MRDDKGRFIKGGPGNPEAPGRPKSVPEYKLLRNNYTILLDDLLYESFMKEPNPAEALRELMRTKWGPGAKR